MVDVTDIVGDHILEDANVQLIGEKIGKGAKIKSDNSNILNYDNGEEVYSIKDALSNSKKRIQELEDYSTSIQKELTKTQENLMREIEEKSKYVKQLNTSIVEKEELKQANMQLKLKIANLEKLAEQQKKAKRAELESAGKKEKSKRTRESDLKKALELGTTADEPVAKPIPKVQTSRIKKDTKKTSTVQINFPRK